MKELLNKIHHADCLSFMKQLPDKCIDLVLTDPPYGIKRDKGFGGFGAPIARKQYKGEWDLERPSQEYFDEMLRVSKSAIIFGGNFFADLLPVGNHWLVWDKLNTMPTFGDCELAWTNIKRNSVKKIVHEYNGLLGKEEERFHATQKPLQLFKKCIQHSKLETGIVLDCFSGSGTTALACHDLGLDFICIEKDADYHAASVERLEQHKRQLRLI